LKAKKGSIVHEPAHLIDVLPTLEEITKCEIPPTWPDRQLRPVSGVSLKSILDGQTLGSRPPIHLLFSSDRGLRDGDWKAVSFRGAAWELYNLAGDRTELENLAATELERLEAMVQTWTDMTRDVLHAPPRVYAPTAQAKLPHRHPEWTNFAAAKPGINSGLNRRSRAGKSGIRARKNTKLTIKDGMLQLEFTGDDPGIAMDLRSEKLPAGPYRLTFRLLGGSPGGGDVFYTTDPKTTLPQGERLSFEIRADGNWHDVDIKLPTDQRLQQLRIDVSHGTGKASIADLLLKNETGLVISSWPQKEK
jgi:arylsulfatase